MTSVKGKPKVKARAGARSATKARTPPRRVAERRLSKDTVVVAALADIDRNGLEEFSLRGVAKLLEVYPTAVSWHVSNKSQLLAEVVALAMSGLVPPGFPASWQSFLRQIFVRFREMLRRHPNIAPLIGTQLIANRGIDLGFSERLLAALEHAGFSGTSLVGAYNSVIAALVGFTTQEFAPIPAKDTHAWQKEVRDRLRKVDAQAYPTLAHNLGRLANQAFILRWQNGIDAPLDGSYRIFIDIMISGLERLAASPPPTPQGRPAIRSTRRASRHTPPKS